MSRLADYVRHAELFGIECVYESASDLDEREAALLRVELDRIEAARKNGHYTVGKRRRRSPEETRTLILALRAEGLVDQAIATRLGIGVARVRRLVRDHPKTALQTRMVERQKWSRNRNLG
jgi:hypothetical protein